jgi:P-type conjugative transfer protein TrbJ
MKKLLLAGVSVIALSQATPEAHAQATVFCANCSTFVWDEAHEIWEGAQWLRQLEQSILQVKYEILAWEEVIKTNLSLPFRIFNDITGTVTEIQGIAQEASMIGERTKFMIDHLSTSGFGGSLDDIPTALAQENASLSWAMNQLGLAAQRSQDIAADYSAQLAVLEAQEAEGPTQAAQIANQISATRGQQAAAYQAAEASAWQAMATAKLREAHKNELLEAKIAQNQVGAIAGACGQLTVITTAICQDGGGGVQMVAAAQE